MIKYTLENKNNTNKIIFLHDALLGKWIWNKQYKTFKDYESYYIDLLNHGESSDIKPFSINKMSEILKEFILNIKDDGNVNLIGIGLGGLIAFDILSKYPKIIDKVIVSGISIPQTFNLETFENSSVNYFDNSRKFLENKKPSFIISGWFANYGISKKDYWKDMEKSIYRLDAENLKRISFEAMNYKINEIKDKSKGKDLLISYGTKEERVVSYSTYEFQKKFPDAKCIKVKDGNHLWNILDYELFNKVSLEFLNTGKVNNDKRISFEKLIF